jgi:uncharacterized protein YbjT (DUF2867 family)
MRAILFGATGMVGQGLLRECLLDPEIDAVVCVSRSSLGQRHEKLREMINADFYDYSSLDHQLTGFDACFFCLGVSSAGMSEANYVRLTYDLTMAAAKTLAKLNSGMTFIYVSGQGTDSTQRGRSMWARVKGKTENDLLGLPFKAAYMFRPGAIQALHGIKSKTAFYRVFYVVGKPIFPLLRLLFPQYVTTTEQLGRAMIRVAKQGYSKPIIEAREINGI